MRAVLRRMELLEARMSEQDSHLGSLGVVSSKTGGMMASLSVRQDQLDAKVKQNPAPPHPTRSE